jgi:alpha-tubulin suppressor-like RCC1 family protein
LTATNTATSTKTNTATNTATSTKTNTATNTATKTNTPTKTNTVVIAAPTQPRPTIGDSGQIITWGDSTTYKLKAVPNGTNSGIAQAAIGAHHALAVTSAGNVIGWGTNMKGELTIPPLTNVVQVAIGLNHSVALKNNGDVVMWGDPAARTAPVGGTLTNITQIATGDRHTIVLRNDGRVFVYGDSSQRTTVPAIVNSKYIVGIAAGADSSFALSSDGAVYQWGKSMVLPVRIAGSIMRIFATGNLFGALRSDGELNLFGPAVNNLTLSGSAVSVSSATSGCPCVKILNMDGLQNINLTKWGVILARRARQPIAFAYNGSNVPTVPAYTYQLSTHPSHDIGIGVAPTDSQLLVPTATPLTGITLRGTQTFNTPGYLRVWGNDTQVTGAIPDSAQSALLQVVAGFRHITVLRSDGAVVSWGDNRFQQRNVPSDLQQSRPLTDTQRVAALASGANHTLALRSNGTVVAWGNNDAGQTTVPADLTNVVQISAGVRHSVALLSNGTVRSWGDDSFGQLT